MQKRLSKRLGSKKTKIGEDDAVILVGQRAYDNLKSPRPDITHPIHYGEEFIVVESIDLENIQKLQALNMWVMAKRKAFPNETAKKVPISCLAVKKSLDSYSWFFGKIDRAEAVNILERDLYPKGIRGCHESVENFEVLMIFDNPG